MGLEPNDLEAQAEMVRERVQDGVDMLDEYAGPLLDRYGRVAIVVGAGVIVAVGVALLLSRRRRKPLLTRLSDRVPEGLASRLERPVASIRSAAGRVTG